MAKFVNCCRIRTTSKTVPNARRTGFERFAAGFWSYTPGHKTDQKPGAAGAVGVMPKTRTGLFCRALRNSGPARRDSIEWDYCKGKDGADGTFYDGTVATPCREMTKYDASGWFAISIRFKNGTFYDENSAINNSWSPAGSPTQQT